MSDPAMTSTLALPPDVLADYQDWLKTIKQRIHATRMKVALASNGELISLYKHVELLAYDEKLRHYADMRISIDLDDGVKVNYGKFGDLLAEVKAVTGGGGDD